MFAQNRLLRAAAAKSAAATKTATTAAASASAAPQLKTAKHPSGVDLLFDPEWHSYKFAGKRLLSISRVLDRFFPFDADAVAAKVAAKELKTVEQVKAEWLTSTVLGTNVHAHIEALLLGEPRRPVADLQGDEDLFYPAATVAANSIAAKYEVVACEAMVCSPRLRIAGTIDFIGRNRETGAIAIMDWKTSSSSASAGFRFGSFDEPCPPPLQHLVNSKTTRYSLQVLLYGHLLRTEGYAANYGRELEEMPIEYGIVQIGRSDQHDSASSGAVSVDFQRVVPECIMRPDDLFEHTPASMLLRAIRS
jgi:hypothetical protein